MRVLVMLLLLSFFAGCTAGPADPADPAPDETADTPVPDVPAEAPIASGSCTLDQPVGGPNVGYRLGSAACDLSDTGIDFWDGARQVLVELTWDAAPTILEVQVSVEGPQGVVGGPERGASGPVRLTFSVPDAAPGDLQVFVDVTGVAVDQKYTAWVSTFAGPAPDGYSAVPA